MNTRESRFVGNGNAWVGDGKYRGFQVTCSRCSAPKIVTSHNGSSLPPNVIVKKLTQAGWYIGKKAEDDICGRCRRKPAGPSKISKPNNGFAVETGPDFYTQLRACLWKARQLAEAKNFRSAIFYIDAALRGVDLAPPIADPTMPATPSEPPKAAPQPKRPKPVPQPVATDPSYDQWLREQERSHKGTNCESAIDADVKH